MWNASEVPVDKRWTEIFMHLKNNDIRHQHISAIVQYILSLPGTNAAVERIFSQMNKIWTSEKTQLKVSTLKALLVTKVNFTQSCIDFYTFLKSSPQLLKQISSTEKYAGEVQ